MLSDNAYVCLLPLSRKHFTVTMGNVASFERDKNEEIDSKENLFITLLYRNTIEYMRRA